MFKLMKILLIMAFLAVFLWATSAYAAYKEWGGQIVLHENVAASYPTYNVPHASMHNAMPHNYMIHQPIHVPINMHTNFSAVRPAIHNNVTTPHFFGVHEPMMNHKNNIINNSQGGSVNNNIVTFTQQPIITHSNNATVNSFVQQRNVVTHSASINQGGNNTVWQHNGWGKNNKNHLLRFAHLVAALLATNTLFPYYYGFNPYYYYPYYPDYNVSYPDDYAYSDNTGDENTNSYSTLSANDNQIVPAENWVAASNGDVPANAEIYNDANGSTTYYCRSAYSNQEYYGVLVPQDGCYVNDQSVTLRFVNYEVLLNPSS